MSLFSSPSEFVKLGCSLFVAQSSLYQTNSGIFLRDGDAYLIDPCVYPAEIDAIKAFVNERRANVRGIVLTHSHWDHILGPERISEARIIASTRFSSSLEQRAPRVLEQMREWETASSIERAKPYCLPTIDVHAKNEDALEFGAGKIRIYETPGHTADHIALFEPSESILWAGDMLSDIEIPIIEDVVAYLSSVEQLMKLDVRVLIPGHGSPTTDKRAIRQRFVIDYGYLKTLMDSVTNDIDRGCSLDDSVALCRDFTLPSGRLNSHDHIHNVRSAYKRLRGRS